MTSPIEPPISRSLTLSLQRISSSISLPTSAALSSTAPANGSRLSECYRLPSTVLCPLLFADHLGLHNRPAPAGCHTPPEPEDWTDKDAKQFAALAGRYHSRVVQGLGWR